MEEKQPEIKAKRKYVRRTQLTKPSNTISSSSSSSSSTTIEEKEYNSEDCAICLEECKHPLPCKHYIHTRCIALSGQNTCSICRAQVHFSREDQQEYDKKRAENEEEKRQRELNESLTLANQLQREMNRGGGGHQVHRNRNMLHLEVYDKQFRVTLTPSDAPLPADELMLQLNQVMVHVATNRREFTADRRVIDVYKIMMDLNRVSATTGVEIKDICNIFQTLSEL